MDGRILRKRIPRDLKTNWARYVALGFMIVLCMYIILSVLGAAYTIKEGAKEHADRNHLEDGQFSVFVPLKSDEITDIESDGVELEEQFYLDYDVQTKVSSGTLRVFKNRKKIDLIEPLTGRAAGRDLEVLLERRYCEENGIHVGDRITIGKHDFKVVGIGTTPDYDGPYKALSDAAVDSETFGTAFVTEQMYEALLAEGSSAKAEEYTYAYRFTADPTDVAKNGQHLRDERDDALKEKLQSISFDPNGSNDSEFRKYWYRQTGMMGILFRPGDTFMGESVFGDEFGNLTMFLPAGDNMRILAGAADVETSYVTCLLAGIILLILFTYIISVFVVHNIDRESAVIGTLYAMGVRKNELVVHYLMLPVLVTGLAGVIGTLLGFSPMGIPWQMGDSFAYYSMPDMDIKIPFYLWIYGLVMPGLCALLVNWFVIRRKCNQPVLSLLQHVRREQKPVKADHRWSRGNRSGRGREDFTRRFAIRQIVRGRRAVAGLLAGLFISLLLVMLSLDTATMCGHVKEYYKSDTKYEYMYNIKYPDDNPPPDGTACFVKGLKKERLGYNLDVTVLGTTEDNPYFDAKTPKGGRNVVISSAMAQKYKLDAGDEFTLEDPDEDRTYVFRVTDVTEYATAFYVFMNIDSARELFDEDENYYNVVFSDHRLDIPSGKLYGVTSKKDVVKAGAVFVDMMRPMITMLMVISALIFAIEMYLMIRVMIDREAFGISLMKIFGWKTRGVKKLYLGGSFAAVLVGTAVLIPLSKLLIDLIFPYFVANVGCGMDLSLDWWIWPALYLAVIGLYYLISRLLVRHLDSISPVVVLKNRE
ncbi:MAG: ABC transporter permease [Bacillota bacterium]|nr:ABC transporter permease [Bacillota bacterium]